MLGATGAATAQGADTDVDIAAVGEAVLAAEPDAFATRLETPPDDALLPEGFLNPPSGKVESAEIIEQFTGAIGEIEGSVATINHGFDTDPDLLPQPRCSVGVRAPDHPEAARLGDRGGQLAGRGPGHRGVENRALDPEQCTERGDDHARPPWSVGYRG